MGRPSKPQRRENEQIVYWVNRCKNDQNDAEAFGQIVGLLESFLQHLSVKKFFFVAGHNSDDLYQEGLMALASKAIPDYDENKGPFINFAKLCVRRHIITVLKTANSNKNKCLNMSVSMDQTVCKDEDNGPIPISGFIPCEDTAALERIVRGEAHSRLKALLLSKLTALEAKVLGLYLRNMSYMDIVARVNKRKRGKNRIISKTVDNALCRIKKKAVELEEAVKNGDETLKIDLKHLPKDLLDFF